MEQKKLMSWCFSAVVESSKLLLLLLLFILFIYLLLYIIINTQCWVYSYTTQITIQGGITSIRGKDNILNSS